jgi:RNA-directed DNA polymerase
MIYDLPSLYTFLGVDESRLKDIINNIHQHYRFCERPKKKFRKVQLNKSGQIRYRYLFVPSNDLKKIQRAINCYLQKIELPSLMYGSVPGKNHIMNAQQHLNQSHFLTVDLKNFFTNISHQQVFQMLIGNCFTPAVARMVTKLTTYKGYLPQGAPSSPVIANLCFLKVARKMADFSIENNIRFTVFLDDLSFSSKTDFKKLVPEILNSIKSCGFFPSSNKIHYSTYKSEITGIIVCKNKVSVIKEMRKEAQTNAHLNAYINSVYKSNLNVLKI